ncbi:MAG TPA: alpha-E domain-containing protein [Steroidobacteraceae bacterium]|nr:alpha-E domain-containing protein [Steroidobacteraceae bacterium]
MLSRTADHLYWLARYLERAETVARMLEAEQQLALLPRPAEIAARSRRATLVALGAHEAYDQYAADSRGDVLEFLAFDRDYGGSIVSCIARARENARAVRGAVASEMWETINATWLEMRQLERRKGAERTRLLFDHVRQRAHMIRGVTVVAMLRDEAFHFLRLGSFLERADGTVRLLDARSSSTAAEPHGEDPHEWTVLLRTLSAFEAYRRLFRDAVHPQRVAEMFLLRPDVPRSLRRCLIEVRENLRVVANDQSAHTARVVGALQAQLEFGDAAELASERLPAYLTDKIEQLRRIGEGIARDFLVSEAVA